MDQSMLKAGIGLGSDNRFLESVAYRSFNPTALKTHRNKYQTVIFMQTLTPVIGLLKTMSGSSMRSSDLYQAISGLNLNRLCGASC